ncbi:hypothetical protein PoB_004889300 [Plakobranchus ocellatus]|uniref:Uncharacterized protein n=1 Tax=Plakobranchus ocellatus TaxID=259542 RepID=A0AAV4BS01_9GAST|nr:hypothetical protein PoB_004889300 [Plakobranchus ocellatus]
MDSNLRQKDRCRSQGGITSDYAINASRVVKTQKMKHNISKVACIEAVRSICLETVRIHNHFSFLSSSLGKMQWTFPIFLASVLSYGISKIRTPKEHVLHSMLLEIVYKTHSQWQIGGPYRFSVCLKYSRLFNRRQSSLPNLVNRTLACCGGSGDARRTCSRLQFFVLKNALNI